MSPTTGDPEVVSIVIPCRNEVTHIRQCVDSLLVQEVPDGRRLEILIADGMSDDGTRQILVELAAGDDRVRVIDNPDRIVATGLNRAIGASKGSIIIRIDVHTAYEHDYLCRCVAVLEETGADNVGGPWIARGRDAVSRAVAAAFASPLAMGGARGHDPAYRGEVDTVYLGCWWRRTFDRLGGFDESLVRNQDDEFNLRTRRAGGRVFQCPTIRSCYYPRSSFGALWRQYFQYGYWKVLVIRKHRLPAAPRHLAPSAVVTWMALAWLPALWWADWLAWYGVPIALYAALVVAASIGCIRRAGRSLPLVPLAIVIMHVAYGIGMLRGLLDLVSGRFGSGGGVRSLTR